MKKIITTVVLCLIATTYAISQCNHGTSVSGNQTICSSVSTDSAHITLTGSATSYILYPSTGVTVTSDSTFSIRPSITTTYLVAAIDTACTDSLTSFTITVVSLPTISVVATNNPICPNTQSTITATGATNISINGSSSSINVSPSVPTTYSVIGYDYVGCATTTSYFLNVDTNTVRVRGTSSVTCGANSNVYLSDTLTATGATSYTWAPSNGLNVTTGPIVIATPTVTTTFTVSSVNNCPGQNSATFTVNHEDYQDPVHVSFTDVNNVPITSMCADATAVFTDVSPSVGGNNLPGVLTGSSFLSGNSQGATFNASAAGAGNYSLRYTITSALGCTTYASCSGQVFAIPATYQAFPFSGNQSDATIIFIGTGFTMSTELVIGSSTFSAYSVNAPGTQIIFKHVYVNQGQQVIIQSLDGCFNWFNWGTLTGVQSLDKDMVKIYPIPLSSEFLTIELPNGEYFISLFNLLGAEVASYELKGNELKIPKGDLPKGILLLRIKGKGLTDYSDKIINE